MRKTVHTVVEIFDSVNLKNNILTSLIYQAKCTIFLYEAGQEESMKGVVTLLREKNPEIKIKKILIKTKHARDRVFGILGTLYGEREDVVVEMNGGNMVISNYAREASIYYDLPCIMLDVENERIIHVENASEWVGKIKVPMLGFSDILTLQGRTYERNMHMLADEKYDDRILSMAEYIFSHQSDVKFFYDFVHHKSDGELSEPGLKIVLKRIQEVSPRIMNIFHMLESQGFIKEFRWDEQKITFICVEYFVKEMLAVKGSWLEMYVYILAKRSGLFSEVYQSVMIGWDLEQNSGFHVQNEIDVVLMKKGVPIFISCKMTNPKPEALNEIYALANSFGGYGAVAVLVTSSDVRNRSKTLYNRAKEMGICLLDASDLNRTEIRKFFEEKI